MAKFEDYVKTALDQYPKGAIFLQWRSGDSIAAVDYLRQKLPTMQFPKDEPLLLAMVKFFLDGSPNFPGQPGTVRKIKTGGRLHGLLKTAWDDHMKKVPARLKQDKLLNYFDGKNTLAGDPGAQDIELAIRMKYDFAMTSWRGHKPDGQSKWKDTMEKGDKVSSLAGLKRHEHLAVIDQIWGEILELKDGTTPVSGMVDPAPGAHASSHSGRPAAFKTDGYCFRCDTRLPADVMKNGFLPLYAFRPPPEVMETLPVMSLKAKKIGMFKDNRDAVGQMVICVARQLKGCTKFPDADTVGAAYVYAIKLPLNKTGFDTELWQTTLKPVSLWKPGEKAMFDVQPGEVIAHIEIDKALAGGAGGLFRFRFKADKWTPRPGLPSADEDYLKAELAAIYNGGAIQSVSDQDDFARY